MRAQYLSGSGASTAMIIGVLSRIDTTRNHPQAICLFPTRELAIQTGELAARIRHFIPNLKILYVVRGEHLSNAPFTAHLIVATPGKLLATCIKLLDVNLVRVLALDEADLMIGSESLKGQVLAIHSQLPTTCQHIFFSATDYADENVKYLSQAMAPDGFTIKLPEHQQSMVNAKHFYVKCRSHADKYEAIQNIYDVIIYGQAILFCSVSI